MTKNHVTDVDHEIERLQQGLNEVVRQSKENLRALSHLEARHGELVPHNGTNGNNHEEP